MAAIQVETDEQARRVFLDLNRRGRWFYVDAEFKQDLHLLGVAAESLAAGNYTPIKPNDSTVNAFQSVLNHRFGPNLTNLSIGIYGTGNLALKFALRAAELGGEVVLAGRDDGKVERLLAAINSVLPSFSPHRVTTGFPGQRLQVLASAVTAEHVITEEWLASLSPSGCLCIDVGINNFSPKFIEKALAVGHRCMRLDVRSAGDPLPPSPNPFFDQVLGRDDIDGVPVIAGGYMGQRGEVVVDRIVSPARAIGVANGTGGLLPDEEWTDQDRSSLQLVRASIAVTSQSFRG